MKLAHTWNYLYRPLENRWRFVLSIVLFCKLRNKGTSQLRKKSQLGKNSK